MRVVNLLDETTVNDFESNAFLNEENTTELTEQSIIDKEETTANSKQETTLLDASETTSLTTVSFEKEEVTETINNSLDTTTESFLTDVTLHEGTEPSKEETEKVTTMKTDDESTVTIRDDTKLIDSIAQTTTISGFTEVILNEEFVSNDGTNRDLEEMAIVTEGGVTEVGLEENMITTEADVTATTIKKDMITTEAGVTDVPLSVTTDANAGTLEFECEISEEKITKQDNLSMKCQKRNKEGGFKEKRTVVFVINKNLIEGDIFRIFNDNIRLVIQKVFVEDLSPK